jgi:hypothetical protein
MSSVFPGAEAPRGITPPDPIPEDVRLFSAIEGLVGEEHALLLIPEHQRSGAQRERLRAVTEQLDRIWEKLRERADSHGVRPGVAPGDAGAAPS